MDQNVERSVVAFWSVSFVVCCCDSLLVADGASDESFDRKR